MAVVLVFAETNDGVITERSLGLLAGARAMAGAGGQVAVVVVDAQPPASGLAGATEVHWAQSTGAATSEARAEALLAVDAKIHPDVILIPNSIAGMDVAAEIAVRMSRPLVAYCSEAEIRDGELAARCLSFGGRAVATVEAPLPAVVLATFDVAAIATGESPKTFPIELRAGVPRRIAVQAVHAADAASVDIAVAERIVCIGRGIGEAENIQLAKELAGVLGAELAASRPLVDLGWVEKERQVGKSGRTVKPKLYLALGVSGAAEHLEGMRHAGTIIAVNTNPSAPIFEVARWGTTCDVIELLPALTNKLRGARG